MLAQNGSSIESHELGDRLTVPGANKHTEMASRSTSISTLDPVFDPSLSVVALDRLSMGDVDPVRLDVRDLAITVDLSPWFSKAFTRAGGLHRLPSNPEEPPPSKTILRSINASLAPGSLTAILGGSGSGKTTLLNTLAERIHGWRLTRTGVVSFNGLHGVDSIRYAYAMQQDILQPMLTVRETLKYAADLRLPQDTTEKDRAEIVEEVIIELGLKDCADTRIGDSRHRGCSGGEKRRTSIGVQLLANPSILFLDEPTTGLDSASAFQLVRTLKALAMKGRTIITTIHQPRSEIWSMFDNLILLTRGTPVYSGSIADCEPWFSSLGYYLPSFVNPAEFFIDLAAVDNRSPSLEQESTARVNTLMTAWAEESQLRLTPVPSRHLPSVMARLHSQRPIQHAGLYRQAKALTDRTLKVTVRDPMGMAGALLEAILMAIVISYIYYALPRDQAGIRSRQAALHTALGLQGYLFMIFETYRLSRDILVFDREHSEGCVTALPFVLSRRLAHLSTEDVAVPFFFSIIYYFMVGFDGDVKRYLVFLIVTFLNHLIAVSLAMTTVVAARSFPAASLIGNTSYTLQTVACGFFIQADTIPIYVRWVKWISYLYYAFSALCRNEFGDSFYDCPYPGGESNPACVSYTGKFILHNLGFREGRIMDRVCILIGFVVFFNVLSWVGLAFIKTDRIFAPARSSIFDLSAGKEKLSDRSMHEVRAIDVSLEKVTLCVDKKIPTVQKIPTKTILNSVSAVFHAGTLNVIMGPSGSGKTSLLDTVALRLNDSLCKRHRISGKMTFNGAVPSPSVVKSTVSYVCQDDDALLPSLTVRETLRFSAGLRLPSWMKKHEKYQRAEEVLLKMGLKDCADNLVGSELVKGISGGEKRRVSIAIQILTDPRVLLLDEPTSGLDAFTAGSIMEVLEGLAREGRTLILTIHQARSDLFARFGNILLLAKGGSAVYAGPAKDIRRYFASLGHHCPMNTNPADFTLDLITIDMQETHREAETREHVERLVKLWARVQQVSPSTGNQEGGTVLADIAEIFEPRDGSSNHDPAEESSSNAADRHVTISAPRPVPKRPIYLPPATSRSFYKEKLASPAEIGAMVHQPASFMTAFPLLARRAIINFGRQPALLIARVTQILFLTVILSLFLAPLNNDYRSVQNRVGFAQQFGSFYYIGTLQNIGVYPTERDVFYREDQDGVYSVEAFLATYTILEVPFEIVSSLLSGVLAVFAVGWPHTPQMYFAATFAAFALTSCGESLGIMFNTLFNHTGFAINIVSVVLTVAQIAGGFMSIHMPPLFHAFNFISPIKYAFAVLAHWSFKDVVFTCTDEQRLPDGRCIVADGQQVLRLYGLDVSGPVYVAGLAVTVVMYRLVAWVLLRATRTRWNAVVGEISGGVVGKRGVGLVGERRTG